MSYKFQEENAIVNSHHLPNLSSQDYNTKVLFEAIKFLPILIYFKKQAILWNIFNCNFNLWL